MSRVSRVRPASVVGKSAQQGSTPLPCGLLRLAGYQFGPDALPFAGLQPLTRNSTLRFALDISAVLDRYAVTRPALHGLIATDIQLRSRLYGPAKRGDRLAGRECFRL